MSADTPTRREFSSALCMMQTTVYTPRMPGAHGEPRSLRSLSHGQISRSVWAKFFSYCRCEFPGCDVSITTIGIGASSLSNGMTFREIMSESLWHQMPILRSSALQRKLGSGIRSDHKRSSVPWNGDLFTSFPGSL